MTEEARMSPERERLEAALRQKYPNDALERLVRSNYDYYSTHGDYLPELAQLLLIERDQLEQAEQREKGLREALRRCGELAMARKTGAIKHLVKTTLGIGHFSPAGEQVLSEGDVAKSGSGRAAGMPPRGTRPPSESACTFNPPYRYEVNAHGPATIYDGIDVGWVARVKESLPHKAALAQVITDALNVAAQSKESEDSRA